MTKNSSLDHAFLATIYTVQTPVGIYRLKAGEFNQEFGRILECYCIHRWGVLTAYNPQAIKTPEISNQARHEELLNCLASRNIQYWPACNMTADGSWPDEHGFMLLNVTRQTLFELAEQFGQLAVIYGSGPVPELLYT